MARKIGTSFVVRQDQMDRLENADESMSQIVRDALDEYDGGSVPVDELEKALTELENQADTHRTDMNEREFASGIQTAVEHIEQLIQMNNE